jgi:hypothetical protein
MKIKTVVTFIAAMIMLGQVHLSLAQASAIIKDDWILLGTRTVDYTLDRDVVSVEESKEIFTALKFVVKKGTLNMHRCTVHFTDGDTKDIEFSDRENKGNDDRIMDMKGSYRTIEKVTFWYDTKKSSDKKSIVEVWGKK